MFSNDKNNNNIKTHNFANEQQKKFYLLTKAFKIGNIIATTVIIFFAGMHFLGV